MFVTKGKRVGAACGRVHPIGSGPIVWVQRMEYALAYWLQKTTEHTLGCVLCAPGCFSLYRASALMDDNVMRMFAQKPKEAEDYLNDLGEDRYILFGAVFFWQVIEHSPNLII